MPFKRPKPREPLAEPALFDYAVAVLARRMRTERELRRLMQTRAEPGPAGLAAMDTVVRRLVELNYLSDTRFAADYTRLRKEGQKLGRRRVQQDLSAKGIAPALANTAIATAYDGVDEAALARDYCARKRMKPPANDKETARTMGRLLRAGFSSGTVFKVLRQWGIPIEEFEVEDA
jgi:regulatory protein